MKTISASSVEEEEAEDVAVSLRKAEKKQSPKEDLDLYSWLARQHSLKFSQDGPRPTPTTDLHVQPVQS